jgi:hypothetical protein
MAKLTLDKKHVQDCECKLRWTKKQHLKTSPKGSIVFEFFEALDESSNENNPSIPSNAFILNFNPTYK